MININTTPQQVNDFVAQYMVAEANPEQGFEQAVVFFEGNTIVAQSMGETEQLRLTVVCPYWENEPLGNTRTYFFEQSAIESPNKLAAALAYAVAAIDSGEVFVGYTTGPRFT